MKEFAFILGNGKSRLVFTPEDLSKHGSVYGCNRIYQEHDVDVLVSTDPGMTQEIISTGYPDNKIHYTREKEIPFGGYSRALNPMWAGFSSGPNALAQACQDGFPYCFLIGMDLISDTSYVNNLYADTRNYKVSTDKPTFSLNWEKQVLEILQYYPNTRGIHVNPLLQYTPATWLDLPNCETMTVNQFRAMINN